MILSNSTLIMPRQKKKHSAYDGLWSILYLPLSCLFLEVMAHLFVFGFHYVGGFFTILLLSLLGGFLFTFLCGFFKRRGRKRFMILILTLLGLFFSFHLVYQKIFNMFFTFELIGNAGAVFMFIDTTLSGIAQCWYKIILMFLPLICFLIFMRDRFAMPKKLCPAHRYTSVIALILAVVMILTAGIVPTLRNIIVYADGGNSSAFAYYGMTTGTLVDLGHVLFGTKSREIENPWESVTPTPTVRPTEAPVPTSTLAPGETAAPATPTPTPAPSGPNSLNIDFDSLIASAPNNTIKNIHKYIQSKPISQKNEYTGMFEGKNLIFLTLECFSAKVIDPELTPTLYKMATEGFQFNNFYYVENFGSTGCGEFMNLTGNIYEGGVLFKSSSHLNATSMGNLFGSNGYATYAFHNHKYTFYDRNVAYPGLGYSYYRGVGGGVINGKESAEYGLPLPDGWPRSDKEMAEVSFDDYINSDQPFHTYYLTVSGHALYEKEGNDMVARHWNDLPEKYNKYSDQIRGYFMANLEVELMLQTLIEKLTAAGKLEDTVFAMCCDHYPYYLKDEYLSELYGFSVNEHHDNNFDLYRQALILWSASMEKPVVVDKPCGTYDIVPTLANLFGLPYDSRLYTGTDILSSSENIVILNTDKEPYVKKSWVTEQGFYNRVNKTFTPSASCTMTKDEQDAYVTLTNKKVNAMYEYSLQIVQNDYYRYVFNKDMTLKASN